jgi:hypothetical protein
MRLHVNNEKNMIKIPNELEPLKDSRVWGVFVRHGDHAKKPIRLNGKTQSCTDPDNLMLYDEAVEHIQNSAGKHSLAVSLSLVSQETNKLWRVMDIDAYKEEFDKSSLDTMLGLDTFIDKSPSGMGYHIWFTFNTAPLKLVKRRAVDNIGGFITLSGNVVKNAPIKHVELTANEQAAQSAASVKQSNLTLLNDVGKMSIAFAYNYQQDLTQLMLENGFSYKGKNLIYEESNSGQAGGKVFPSVNNPYDLAYTHNETGLENWPTHEGKKLAIDAFEFYALFMCGGDKSKAGRVLSRVCKAIDPVTYEFLDITVAQWNARPPHYLPDALIYTDDDWGELIKAILDNTQYRENPVAALCSAITVTSYIAGGTYTTKDYDSTDICLITIGQSKAGKSVTMKGGKRLMPLSSKGNVLSRFGASDEGIQDTFADSAHKPDILYQLDEIGFLFKDLKKGNGGGDRWQTMLEYLAAGHDVATTRSKAGKPGITLNCPYLGIHGNTTMEALKGGLTKEDIGTGAVNRLLFFDADQDVKPKKKGIHSRNEKVIKRLDEIYSKAADITSDKRVAGIRVEIEQAVADRMEELNEEVSGSNAKARHVQMAFKLAFVRAIFNDTAVTLEYFNWGYSVVGKSLDFLDHVFYFHLMGNNNIEVIAEEKLIKKLHENGSSMRYTDAVNIGVFKKMGATKRNALLKSLVEEGKIRIEEQKTTANQTKKFMILNEL